MHCYACASMRINESKRSISADAPVIVSRFGRAVVPVSDPHVLEKNPQIWAGCHVVPRCRHMLATLSPRCSPAVTRLTGDTGISKSGYASPPPPSSLDVA